MRLGKTGTAACPRGVAVQQSHCMLHICLVINQRMHTGHKSDNFIVGLTNVSPETSTPTLYNYTLCGQYPGAVPNGTTVSLYCQDNLPPFRYVIVQIPSKVNFIACEIGVLVRGTRKMNNNILIFTTQTDRIQSYCSNKAEQSLFVT